MRKISIAKVGSDVLTKNVICPPRLTDVVSAYASITPFVQPGLVSFQSVVPGLAFSSWMGFCEDCARAVARVCGVRITHARARPIALRTARWANGRGVLTLRAFARSVLATT